MEELPASGCAGCNPSYSPLQVNTGHMRVRAEPQACDTPSSLGPLHLVGRLTPHGWGGFR